MRVPSGYLAADVGTSTVIARQGQEKFVEDALRRYGTLYSFARQHAQATLPGRTGAIVIDAPGGPWVVRHYARGGAVAAVLGDRYLRFGRRRPWRELWASAWARARGIETPAVAAAVVYPGGPFYRADLATAHVPAAADLADTSIGPQRRNEEERRLAWHAAGRMVRDAAAAGLVHADLNLRNILIAWPLGLPRPYLLDLDRCRIVQRTAPHELAAMIRRLERSARKFERQSGASLAAELSAFRDGCRA